MKQVKVFLVAIFAIAMIFSSCTKEEIYEVVPDKAMLSVFPASGDTETEFKFSAGESVGEITEICFSFGETGEFSEWYSPETVISHLYEHPGQYQTWVKIKTENGEFSDDFTISVTEIGSENVAPVAAFEIKTIDELFAIYDFEAEFVPNLFYRWEIILDSDTLQLQDWTQGGRLIEDYVFEKEGVYEVRLSVANEANVTNSVSHEIEINNIGEFVDSDGQTYPTQRVGDDIFLAVNWNRYTPASLYHGKDSLANHGDGRLYLYEDAVANCPEGWRVATDRDFERLSYTLLSDKVSQHGLGISLKANSSRWTTNPGTNNSGLSVLPAGYGMTQGELYGFQSLDKIALFLTETSLWILSNEDQTFRSGIIPDTQLGIFMGSVRLVKIRK